MSVNSGSLTPILSLVEKHIIDMPSGANEIGFIARKVNESSRRSVEIAEEKFLMHRLLETAIQTSPAEFPFDKQDATFVSAMTVLNMDLPIEEKIAKFTVHPFLYPGIILGVKKFSINTSAYNVSGPNTDGDFMESIFYPSEFLPQYATLAYL